jgi:hypothetical protein
VICGHRLVPLLLFLKLSACSVFSDKFRRAPAILWRASSDCSVLFFSVFLLFLGTAGLFCVFLSSFLKLRRSSAFSSESLAKFPVAVFRRILLVNHMKKKNKLLFVVGD